MENENSGCGKIIAILGAIASIIAIFTFLTGIVSIKDFVSSDQPGNNTSPTEYYQQVNLSTPLVTDTQQPIPTDMLVPTPIPTETPLPDTPEGTILDVGQPWRQGGVELWLTQTWLYPKGLNVQFRLDNLEAHDKSIRYSLDNFYAFDNRGVRVPVGFNICGGCFYFTQDCPPNTQVLPALGSMRFVVDGCEIWYQTDVLALPFDTADSSITEIVITVSGISSITEARWRIPIYH